MQTIELEEIYDFSSDVINLQSMEGFAFLQTVVVGDGVNVDFDCMGRPVAVELINPSKMLNLKRNVLDESRLVVSLDVSDSISVRVDVVTKINLSNPRFIESEVSNDFGIPSGEFAFEIIKREI